jgi:hypothetical protein
VGFTHGLDVPHFFVYMQYDALWERSGDAQTIGRDCIVHVLASLRWENMRLGDAVEEHVIGREQKRCFAIQLRAFRDDDDFSGRL